MTIWYRMVLLLWLSVITAWGAVRLIPANDYESVLMTAIEQSQDRIDIMMYVMALPADASDDHPVLKLLSQLIAAHQRGVRVRVLLDDGTSFEGERSQVNDEAAQFLAKWGIEVAYDEPDRRTHAKSIAIDQSTLVIGSTNWSLSALRYHREHALLVDDQAALAEFDQLFEDAWQSANPSLAETILKRD